jgi:hypothetical protein
MKIAVLVATKTPCIIAQDKIIVFDQADCGISRIDGGRAFRDTVHSSTFSNNSSSSSSSYYYYY